jgi:alpha-ribazole phosphatase/probable phosphoglycerate mutase
MTTTIDLLRHGEVAGGLRLRGYRDDPLNDKGWQQMRNVTRDKAVPWQHIVTSPLQRCALFAEETATRYKLDCRVNTGFKEISFGDWEGQLVSDLYDKHASEMHDFWSNPEQTTPPNGEPYLKFEQRVQEAWQDITSTFNGKHVLLVAHGGTIRCILRIILNFPMQNFFNIDIPNASLSRIIIDDNLSRIGFINGHLNRHQNKN